MVQLIIVSKHLAPCLLPGTLSRMMLLFHFTTDFKPEALLPLSALPFSAHPGSLCFESPKLPSSSLGKQSYIKVYLANS